jgi:hypothetical protein
MNTPTSHPDSANALARAIESTSVNPIPPLPNRADPSRFPYAIAA